MRCCDYWGAQGGELDFDAIRNWFKPNFRGLDQRLIEGEHSNIRQMLGAATSLGLIDSNSQNRYRLVSSAPTSLEAFADDVHDRLIAVDWSDTDSIVLEAYAAMIAITEQEQGTTWLNLSAKDRAARINAAVRREGDEGDDESKKRFNSTKAAPWRRWIIFLGLGLPMPKGDLYPYPVPRLERELERARATNGMGDDAEIEPFIELIANRMPYLDGGRLFQSAADQIPLPPLERRITRVLSGALRDLHDDKRLLLETIGDARQTYAMTGEPHAVKNIKAVHFTLEATDG